jgi:hypothetical protein
MLADHADACNRWTRHGVSGFDGLSIAEKCSVHADELSSRSGAVFWLTQKGEVLDVRRWIARCSSGMVMVER